MSISDILFPPYCKICGNKSEKSSVCSVCRRKLQSYINARTRRIYADGSCVYCRYVFDYDNPIVKKLLFALKRNGDKDLFEFVSHLYEAAIPEGFSGTLVCAPRRDTKRRLYGYDQVEKPCAVIAKRSGGRIIYKNLVKRRGFSADQKNAGSVENRRLNVKGKFQVKAKDIPKNILVADDVVTTGSSLCAVIDAIREKCADVEVSAICLASGNRSSDNR